MRTAPFTEPNKRYGTSFGWPIFRIDLTEMRKLFTYSIIIWSLAGCQSNLKPTKVDTAEPKATQLTGSELAQIHCASCHSYVSPEMLPKNIWKEDVLPAMAQRLGLYKHGVLNDSIFGNAENAKAVKQAHIYPEHPIIAQEDWRKLEEFYTQNAPEKLTSPVYNESIDLNLKQFEYREVEFGHRPPMTTMVKIRPNQEGILFADGKPKSNVLSFLDAQQQLQKNILTFNTPIQWEQKGDSSQLLSVGKNIFPNDLPKGSLQGLSNIGDDSAQVRLTPILKGLQRPIHMAYGDLTVNGQEDVVICEYGDHTGQLVLYENRENQWQPKVIKKASGAIKSVIKDVNKDGKLDIICLMAQGDEGIYYFENQGNGNFQEKRWLRFSPLNGSQNFEYIDFNGDGFDDLLYVCGDNADKTPILKDYHGVYIYLNDGEMNFDKAYFFRMNGAYNALPIDFDKDGDLDIAAISFFPDYANRPEESFVYLENKGNLKFSAQSFPKASNGRWLVMDAGDIDGDGDVDLALGSFVYFLAKGDTTGLSKRWLSESPSVAILENMYIP